jgi:hypothetical protein
VLRGGDEPGTQDAMLGAKLGRSVLRPYMTEVTEGLATRHGGGRSEPRPGNLAHERRGGISSMGMAYTDICGWHAVAE